MLLEIEQKVLCLSELSVHSESLLMEGKAGTRGDAEQLSLKLHSLKSSLLELQRILQDKQTHIQVRDTLHLLKVMVSDRRAAQELKFGKSIVELKKMPMVWILRTVVGYWCQSVLLHTHTNNTKNTSSPQWMHCEQRYRRMPSAVHCCEICSTALQQHPSETKTFYKFWGKSGIFNQPF